MTTIVSSFISDVNSREDRDLLKYFEYGKLLIKSKTNKIIFLDEKMFELVKKEGYDENNTTIILTDKTDIYLYSYENLLINNVYTDNPNKDTLGYFFIMCNKTEWIKEAIKVDPFSSDNFIWIDFGIRHIFKSNTDLEFINKLDNLQNKKYDNIRIGSIWNLDVTYDINLYRQITWWFAGGVFGGNKNSLLLFSDKMREKCLSIIKNHKILFWEVNIWYLIYIENKELFNPYYCSHDCSIIDNY